MLTGGDRMETWIPLTEKEDNIVWKQFKQFRFKPSTSSSRWIRPFKLSAPFITYDLSHIWNEVWNDRYYDELEEKVLHCFRSCTSLNEYIYALDPYHECYWFNPHLEVKRNEFNEWTISFLPDGDYYFFLPKDFRWGFLGYPWEKSISIFGEDLLRSFKDSKPTIFEQVIRKG